MSLFYRIKCKDIALNYKEQHDEGNPLENHYHDGFEIAFFVQARMEYFCENRKYSIDDGDLLFIREYELHRKHYSANRPYLRYILLTERSFLEELLEEFSVGTLLHRLEELENTKASTNFEQRNQFLAIFQILHDLKTEPDRYEDSVYTALLKSNMVTLLIKLSQLLTVQPMKNMTPKEKHVHDIINYIDAHYKNEISLLALSQRFNLNKDYISRIFREVTGFSTLEYLHHKRIIRAQQLLENTSFSITDICFESGFHNLQHFYRVFNSLAGTTPGKYRKS